MGARRVWQGPAARSRCGSHRRGRQGRRFDCGRRVELTATDEVVAIRTWHVRDTALTNRDHTLIMGVLNVTPDSFSDGGRFANPADAVAEGLAMHEAGADIIDVGGESTRPGATPVSPVEESARVAPVIEKLVGHGAVVSIDTRHSEVAAASIAAGAHIVNDVSGLADPAMIRICAEAEVGVVVMHMQGVPATMQDDPRYDDVVGDVRDFLLERIDTAVAGGIARNALCIDPVIGFGKTFEHNLELLARLDELTQLDVPVLLGASRKGFLGTIIAGAGSSTAPDERDAATAATTALGVAAGVTVVRAHDVASTLQSARTADAIVRAGSVHTHRE